MKYKVAIFLIIFSLSAGCVKTTPALELTYLDQGWNKENNFRELSYYTTQGSRLIPYTWFLALEQHDNKKLFKDPGHIESLGFLTPSIEELKTYKNLNQDGLPIGFVKDKPAFVPGERDKFDEMEFMGFNCSTCHTGQINYKDKAIRIDGGPTMADLQTFLERMKSSLDKTLSNESKFDRFAEKVIRQSKQSKGALRNDLKEFTEDFSKMVHRSVTPGRDGEGIRYGYARLDAFGGILNEVVHNLNKTTARIPPDAPVSYPFIWDAPQLEWVQWNGAVNNPIARNAGEVVGVFGKIVGSKSIPFFKSSARLKKLFELEEWLKDLSSPSWPQDIFPKFDVGKVHRGKTIYQTGGKNDPRRKDNRCIRCHSIPSPEPDPQKGWTQKGKYPADAKKQFIKIKMVDVDKVGTDPLMATNFATRIIETGQLSEVFENKKSALAVLSRFVTLTIKNHLEKLKKEKPEEFLKYNGYRLPPTKSPSEKLYELKAYKARPLNGIWATAPYLHNGSVPNLKQLLSPSKRDSKFCVGSHEFDPVNVGFAFKLKNGKCEDNSTLFDTTLTGNWNTGHNYAKDLDEDERRDLLEYLKTL
ncbi:MAG: di-heme-cytochrome C peroxidase [Nitrospirales bacterium]